MTREKQSDGAKKRANWRSYWDSRATEVEVIDPQQERKLVLGHAQRYQGPQARFSFDTHKTPEKLGMTLDLGCGLGASMMDGPHAGAQTVIGADFSFNMLKLAQRKFRQEGVNNVLFVVADVTALPFADSSFDYLTCIGVLQFVNREDAIKGIKESYRVIREGASIIFSIRNSFSPYAITRYIAMRLARLIGKGRKIYMNYESYRGYRRQLKEMGHEILTEHSFGLEPFLAPPGLIKLIRALEIAIAQRTTILRPFGSNYVFEVKRSTSQR